MSKRKLNDTYEDWTFKGIILFSVTMLVNLQGAIAAPIMSVPLLSPELKPERLNSTTPGLAPIYHAQSRQVHSTSPNASTAAQHIRKAEGFIQVSFFREALTELNTASAIYEQLENLQSHRWSIAKTLTLKGVVYLHLSQNKRSLDFSFQALKLAQTIQARDLEAQILSNIASVYSSLSQYQKALDTYEQAMEISREHSSRDLVATLLNNIGLVYYHLSRYDEALKNYDQALTMSREHSNLQQEGTILNNTAAAYERLSQYPKAIETYRQSLSLQKQIGHRLGEGKSLNNLALIFTRLGQYLEARKTYQQALVIFRQVGDRQSEGTTLNNLALTYFHLEDYSEALQLYRDALKILQEIKYRSMEGITLRNMGQVYNRLTQYQSALEVQQQSLDIHRDVGNRFEEGQALHHLAEIYHNLGQHQKAIKTYHQSLVIRKEVGDRAGEALTLSHLGAALEDLQQRNLAIVFYKESVNTYEVIRSELQDLSQEQRQIYTDSIALTYRHLADLLLQNDRILEAQQVLDLLKVQELDDYLKTVRGNSKTAKGITILQPELAILRQFEESQASAIQLGQELTQLRQIDKDSRTQKQQKRIDHLVQLQLTLNQDFNQFIESAAVQDALNQLSRKAQRESVELEDLDALRDNLAQLNAVLLYPLILEDRLELVLTTPSSAPIRRTVSVSRRDLNQTIVDFRRALQDPQSQEAQSIAHQLYSWLIAPIEDELTEANTEAIIYSPDGQLRYIPLGALHDGDEWLIQRLRINNITAKSFSNLNPQTSSDLSLLAGAFVKGQFQFQVGTEQFSFAGLPFAGEELSQLIATIPGTTHFLDQAFSLESFQPQMNEHRIIHLATHAAFVPGQPEDSFILFGNGDRATLRDIGNWSLFNVDLVVLSACETGLGGNLGNGEEILGLGYQFQNRGAKATIASLWQVDDGGTQTLMEEFYQQLKAGKVSKAEALRRAQIKMIMAPSLHSTDQRGRVVVETKPGPLNQGSQPWAHPYYWAPFILIGNGL